MHQAFPDVTTNDSPGPFVSDCSTSFFEYMSNRAAVYLPREEQSANRGAAYGGAGAGVEERRARWSPPSVPNANELSVPQVKLVPLWPLASLGMSQAQIDAMTATLQAQNDVLRRTQDQQASSNEQIMTSMAFLVDTMKKFQPISSDL